MAIYADITFDFLPPEDGLDALVAQRAIKVITSQATRIAELTAIIEGLENRNCALIEAATHALEALAAQIA